MKTKGVFLERAMGIELHPKSLSLTETRCYQPLRESIVAKCCQTGPTHQVGLLLDGPLLPARHPRARGTNFSEFQLIFSNRLPRGGNEALTLAMASRSSPVLQKE